MNRGQSRGGGRHHGSSRGRSPHSGGRYVQKYVPVGVRSSDPSLGCESELGSRNSEMLVKGVTEKFDSMLTSDCLGRPPSSVPDGVGNMSPCINVDSKLIQNKPELEHQTPMDRRPVVSRGCDSDVPSLSLHCESNTCCDEFQPRVAGEGNCSSPHLSCTPLANVMHKTEGPSQAGFRDGRFSKEIESGKSASEVVSGDGEFGSSDNWHKGCSFDICLPRGNVVKLKSSLLVKNRAMRNEIKRQMEGENIKELRPGMFLLKGYLTLMDQVNLIKACRDLGRGSGGFYEPGYRDGATLQLKMMCLGKHWDPQASMYVDERPVDGAKPPPIPDEFQQLVRVAIKECHNYLVSYSKVKNARDILPSVSPNICIINYYTTTGKLGLHQDKDESQESLRKGLPVVSFSLGDSANFLYGDLRDIDKAEKVVLESGDVLVFGGKSRNIFHGVTSVITDTAPRALLDETNFRKGRLNLTFREY